MIAVSDNTTALLNGATPEAYAFFYSKTNFNVFLEGLFSLVMGFGEQVDMAF